MTSLSLLIFLCSSFAFAFATAKAPLGTVRVMTYNVWNFDSGPNWAERKLAIARTVRFSRADVVGFQEVRRAHDGSRDQLADLKALLPELPHVAYVVADPNVGGAEVDEGIALFSRWPLAAQSVETLALGEGGDANHRKCLYGLVTLPYAGSSVATLDALDADAPSPPRHLAVFLTHWSFDRKQQLTNVQGTLDFMAKTRTQSTAAARAPQLVMGDFNFYMDYEEPATVFAKGKGHHIPSYSTAKGDTVLPFVDLWNAPMTRGATVFAPAAAERPLASAKSWTFSNIAALKNRPDRIFLQTGRALDNDGVHGPSLTVARAELHGQKEKNGLAPSDHLALLAELRVSSCAGGCAYCGGKVTETTGLGQCLACDEPVRVVTLFVIF